MKNYWPFYILALLFIVLAFCAPILFTAQGYNHFGSTTGFIGDTIGGLTAPFLSLGGSILVFAALKAQIDANKAVQDQFVSQQKQNNKRDFEDKLFKLFDLHLDIVKSSQIKVKQLESTNAAADYPFTEVIGYEYHASIENLVKNYDLLQDYLLFEKSIDILEWTMFDGFNKSHSKKESNDLVSIVLNYYLEKLREVTYRYFNNLFYIIETIEESSIHDELEKKDFINLYLNHFSYSEIKWLFWISFHEDYKNQQPILEKYKCFIRFNYDDLTSKAYFNFADRYFHLKVRFDELRTKNNGL